jgi:hypothetical protein
VLLLEVLSRQTRRLDQGEKKDAYFSIPSLCLYLLVEQESAAVTVYRRTEQGFVRELATGSSIQLSELGIELPLAELYAGVELTVEDEGAGWVERKLPSTFPFTPSTTSIGRALLNRNRASSFSGNNLATRTKQISNAAASSTG